jgi:hypothetical protein
MSSRARIAAACALLVLPLLLSGCAITPYVRVDSGSAAQPTTAAGTYYLDTICPRNAAIYAYDAVRKSHDLATLHRVAVVASVASAKAAAGLRSPDAPWPAAIRGQAELLAESLDLDETSYDQLAAASTLQDAWAVQWPGDTSAGNAKFTIRKALGLGDGQQVDDCVGHYGGTDSANGLTTT